MNAPPLLCVGGSDDDGDVQILVMVGEDLDMGFSAGSPSGEPRRTTRDVSIDDEVGSCPKFIRKPVVVNPVPKEPVPRHRRQGLGR